MADLAKIQSPIDNRQRGTKNRDFILPSRRNTSAPDLEVNARIATPQNGEAEKIASILGLAGDLGEQVGTRLEIKEAEKRDEQRAQAGLDAANGTPDDKYAKSKAYQSAYAQADAVRRTAMLEASVTQQVNDRLADQDNPATIEDINELIEASFRATVIGEDGNPLPMLPSAQRVFAEQMARTRAKIMGPALEAIRDQTNTRYADNVAYDIIKNGLGEVGFQAPPTPRVPTAIEQIDPDVNFIEPSEAPASGTAPEAFKVLRGLPVEGAITNTYAQHRERGSKGLDIDGQIGDPIVIRAPGVVKQAGYDPKSGNYIIVDHGGGVVTSYSHLQVRNVKRGDPVTGGMTIGTMGNSGNVKSSGGGDGSHLHYRVKINGSDVDPQTFTFEGIKPGETQAAADTPMDLKQVTEQLEPVALDFEPIMARRPPSMNPAQWKAAMLPALILHAEQENKPELLIGISMSVRPDGTPSFNTAEVAKLRDTAREITIRKREDDKRQKAEVYDHNEGEVLDKISNGENVSIADLNRLGEGGLISPRFRYSLVEGIRNDQKQEERYQTAIERENAREDKTYYDNVVAAREAALRSGILEGSPEDDFAAYERGEYGTGRDAAVRYQRIRTARTSGVDYIKQTPQGAFWAKKISDAFPLTTSGSGLLGTIFVQDNSKNAEAIATYNQHLSSGLPPMEAAQKTLERYGPKPTGKGGGQAAQLEAEIKALESKQ